MAIALKKPQTTFTNNLAKLCKWRVVCLMLVTAVVGMSLAPSNYWRYDLCLFGILGIGLAACAGGICNQILEQHIDAKMRRTQHRPLVKDQISPQAASLIFLIFVLLSAGILFYFVNPLTFYLTFLTMFGYSIIYTKILKPNTYQNIVIGGVFGAMPPLLGWTSLTGSISIQPIILVAIIYTWTPSHFWALSLTKIDDYKKTSLPMLPVTHGIPCTQLHIIAYTILLIIVTQLPIIVNLSGVFYGVGANILNIWLFSSMWQVYMDPAPVTCMRAFKRSNFYLMGLFLIMFLDKIIC